MVININLKGKDTQSFSTDFCNQYLVTKFIHTVFGDNNDKHDTFSDYCVSGIQGGKMVGSGLMFEQGGYVTFSTPNMELLNSFIPNILKYIGKEIYKGSGIYFSNFTVTDYTVGTYFDKLQTTSPIRLKNFNDEEITFNNEEFIEVLNEKMKAKLLKFNPEINLNRFGIEIFKVENAKEKYVSVKEGVYNKSSQLRLIVRGNMATRRIAYLLGFGQSTGCGFGSIKVL
ncbi:MAG: CRISPR-associated endoribonuclease Cas6 [Bacteroidales bacterium]